MQKGKEDVVNHMLCKGQRKHAEENYSHYCRKNNIADCLFFKHSRELKYNADIETIVADVLGDFDIYFNVSLLGYFVDTQLSSPLFTCRGELRDFRTLCMGLYGEF